MMMMMMMPWSFADYKLPHGECHAQLDWEVSFLCNLRIIKCFVSFMNSNIHSVLCVLTIWEIGKNSNLFANPMAIKSVEL